MTTRKNKKRLSLATKFYTLTILLVLASSTIIASYVIHNEVTHSFKELVDHGMSTAVMVSQNSEYGIYTEDVEAIQKVVQSLAGNPDIAYVSILNAGKQELCFGNFESGVTIPTSYRDKTFEHPDDIYFEKFVSDKNGKRYIDIMTPVIGAYGPVSVENMEAKEPALIGYVQLGLSQQGLHSRLHNYLVSLATFTVFFLLSGSALTFFMTKKFIAPLNKLAGIALEISKGNFDHAIQEQTSDEMEDLAQALKDMLSHICVYQSDAEERTMLLKYANNKLQQQINERKETENALQESEERYSIVAQGVNDGLWDWNVESGEVYFTPRWKNMVGMDSSETMNSLDDWLDRIHEDDREKIKLDLDSHLDGRTSHFENEHRLRHRKGDYFWTLCRGFALKNASGKPYRMAGSITDIDKRKKAEEQLLHDALHDTLTGLPNRALFKDRLSHTANIAERSIYYLFAVLFLDIDRFKIINDSLGHRVGDQLLIEISHRLEQCLRPGDTVARLGGDEFALLLAGIKDTNDATYIAKRIQKKLQLPAIIDGHEIFISASIGVAIGTREFSNPDEVINFADIAMYHAKMNGKARYELFDQKMHTKVVDRLNLETALRKAIDHQEFHILYQPIVSTKTFRLKGFEALIRWQHPEYGLIQPNDFISVAEETGLIIPMGRWVLQEACGQAKRFQDEFPSDPPYSISVNIAGSQFSPLLVKDIKEIFRETGLDGSSLKLEITESMLIKNAEKANHLLLELRELNVGLHIDDFGTGHSSLSYLHKLPITMLKIDRSFIARMGMEPENTEIVKAIITLAHNLNMETIAEGVETEHQVNILYSLGCDLLQGFLFSKPLTPEEACDFMRMKELYLRSALPL